MQTGVGIDIVALAEFEQQLSDPASAFIDKTFSPDEITYANQVRGRQRVSRLAARYAAREAFLKAWSSLRAGREPAITTFPYHLVEVTRDAHGRPEIVLAGLVRERFERDGGGDIQLSLSHDGPVAAAIVMIVRANPSAA